MWIRLFPNKRKQNMLIYSQEFRDNIGYFPVSILNISTLRKYCYLAVPLSAKRDVTVCFSVSKNLFFCTGFWHRMKCGLLPGWLIGKVSACQCRRCRFNPWVDFLEEEMAAHSSVLTYRIPWTEEPRGLRSIGSQRVRHN